MLEILGRTQRFCDGLPRRDFLRMGTLGLGGIALPGLLQGRAASAVAAPQAKRVLLLWMGGGPAHHESFDPKPDAPAEVRGEFGTVERIQCDIGPFANCSTVGANGAVVAPVPAGFDFTGYGLIPGVLHAYKASAADLGDFVRP